MIDGSQSTEKLMRNFKALKPISAGLCIYALTNSVSYAVTPVLDGFAYELNSNITIDTQNHNIIFDSNMLNCQQLNGDPPLDTQLFAISTNSQFIGVTSFYYSIDHGNYYFNSETGDILCDNGVYVDTIFSNDFE